VVDATGVGARFASFLADRLSSGPRQVIVSLFLFNRKTKSDLGWTLLRSIDGGRLEEYASILIASAWRTFRYTHQQT
jgi:hypothetical protein